MAVGRRIRFFRLKNNMKQKELGLLLGFPKTSAEVRVNQYESEYRVPKRDTLEKLGKIFGVAPEVFMVPDIDTGVGLMQTFFALEDFHGVRVTQFDDKLALVLTEGKGSPQSSFNNSVLKEWLEQKQALDEGRISKEQYDSWRYHYTEKKLEEHLLRIQQELFPEEK